MQTEATPHLPLNHVFVDLENVKVIDPAMIGGKNLTLHLFFGPQNKKLDVGIVELLLNNAQSVKLIRSPKAGKNALDFVLAYHLGQAVLADPKGHYHLVSKDTGFDALVELLKSRNVKVRRHDDWSGLHFQAATKPATPTKEPATAVKVPATAAKATPAKAPATPAKAPATPADTAVATELSPAANKLLENLRKAVKDRPRRKSTLVNHAKAFHAKNATAEALERVVAELQDAGYLEIDDKRAVTYKL